MGNFQYDDEHGRHVDGARDVAAFKGGALAPIPAEYQPDDQSARYDFSAVDKVAITWPRPHGRPITFASY